MGRVNVAREPLVDPRTVFLRDPVTGELVRDPVSGRKITLADQPLVAYKLYCGHLGRQYAVKRRDILFCEECGRDKRVKEVLAS